MPNVRNRNRRSSRRGRKAKAGYENRVLRKASRLARRRARGRRRGGRDGGAAQDSPRRPLSRGGAGPAQPPGPRLRRRCDRRRRLSAWRPSADRVPSPAVGRLSMTIRLADEPFAAERELAEFTASLAGEGAVVTFLGIARPRTPAGEQVERLILDHHPSLTLRSLNEIADAARERF